MRNPDEKLKDQSIELKVQGKAEESGREPDQTSTDSGAAVNAPSEAVPGYSIIEELGAGSSGIVYKARHEASGRIVAIKLLKKELFADLEGRRRFEREVDTLSKIEHPNVVSILQFGVTPDQAPYIVMDSFEGRSIKGVIESGTVFDEKSTVSIAREIVRGLRAAHSEHIIHRDLKPSNIVVNNANIARIVDFGVAKALTGAGETITQLGNIVGSPAYMSPEQCLGELVDARSDIYSLGCTLFEMLTGTKAFDTGNPVEAIARHLNKDRSQIERLLRATRVSTDLQTVVLKCLSREPKDRYQNVDELDHDLGAVQLNRKIKKPAKSKLAELVSAMILGMMMALLVTSYFYLRSSPITPSAPGTGRHFMMAPLGFGVEIHSSDGKLIYKDNQARSVAEAIANAFSKGVSLAGADLRGAQLNNSRLMNGDLSNADLRRAKLSQASLTNVTLSGAKFEGANLTEADLVQINATGADFSYCWLINTTASSCTFLKASFRRSILQDARMDGSFCEGANFTTANLHRTDFTGADLKGCSFHRATILQTNFINANLENADFSNAHVVRPQLGGTKLTGANIGDTGMRNPSK